MEGLVPVVDDWHGNVCLLKVCLYIDYACNTSMIHLTVASVLISILFLL